MKYPRYWWIVRFIQIALVLTLIFMFGVALLAGLWYPTSSWLFADGWQWMPFDRWLRYVLVCIPIGLWAAFLLTAYEWWQNRE
jgi:hypothetical protein